MGDGRWEVGIGKCEHCLKKEGSHIIFYRTVTCNLGKVATRINARVKTTNNFFTKE